MKILIQTLLEAIPYAIQLFLAKKDQKRQEKLQQSLNLDLNLNNVGSETSGSDKSSSKEVDSSTDLYKKDPWAPKARKSSKSPRERTTN